MTGIKSHAAFLSASLLGWLDGLGRFRSLNHEGTTRMRGTSHTNLTSVSHPLLVATLVALVVLSRVHPTEAMTYYVNRESPAASDTNGGTHPDTDPWLTIQHSLDVMVAGDSTIVYGGSYFERVVTTQNGTEADPICLLANPGDTVYVNAADDLPDSAFTKTPGYTNIYQLIGFTDGQVQQTHFSDIVVDDPGNRSYFVMVDEDGPIGLTTSNITSLSLLDSVEGGYLFVGDTLFVHPFDHSSPSDTATDLWLTWGTPALRLQGQFIVMDGFRILHAQGSSGAVTLTPSSYACEVRNLYVAGGSIISTGEANVISDTKVTHVNNRSSADNWSWYTNNSGSGLALGGRRLRLQRVEVWHCWNGVSSGLDSLVVDALVIHGCPNHAWLPSGCSNLTIRGLVE